MPRRASAPVALDLALRVGSPELACVKAEIVLAGEVRSPFGHRRLTVLIDLSGPAGPTHPSRGGGVGAGLTHRLPNLCDKGHERTLSVARSDTMHEVPGEGSTTMSEMTDRKLWTAEELEKLSAAERTEIVRAGIVTDISQVPEAFLERVRANVREHIAETESVPTPDR